MESQTPVDSFLSKRRQIMLQRLKSRRDQIFNKTRNILNHEDGQRQTIKQDLSTVNKVWSLNHQEEQTSKQNGSKIQLQNCQKEITRNKQKKYKKNKKLPFYCNFQYPDWMIEIPLDIIDFYVFPRPKGQRVLLVFKYNKLLVYSQQGLTKTQVMISNKHYDGTVLEGYYLKNQSSQSILISDLLIWRKNQMVSSQFQFRLAWLLSNINANILNEINISNKRNLTLKLLEYAPFSAQNLIQLYKKICDSDNNSKLSHQVDGILFIHKQSFYLYQVNPHVLFWKDENMQRISLCKIEKYSNNQKSIFDKSFGIQVQSNSELMTEENDYFDVEQKNGNTNAKNINPIFSGKTKFNYNCEYQLQKLSLNNSNTNQHVFYGKMTKNGNIFTFDDVFLIWLPNLNQTQQKIIKFSFTEMSYELSKVGQFPKNCNQMDQQTTHQDVSIKFSNFRIHQIYEIHKRIPDCLSKIIFKYKMKQSMKRKEQTRNTTNCSLFNPLQIDQNPTIQNILNSVNQQSFNK